MAVTADDVPERFDVVLNAQGYVFADLQDVKAELGLTPTFVTRQNVSGDYGDSQQDFWLTFQQKDWSLGGLQRYQGRDEDGLRRYWGGNGIDISLVGEVTLRRAFDAITFGAAPLCAASGNPAYFASASNLYSVGVTGTVTAIGAHGLGAAPDFYGLAVESVGVEAFLTSTAGGSVGVRKHLGGVFSTFSATKCSALAVLNNTLYGIDVTGNFIRFDTVGSPTTIFTWKTADGSIVAAPTQLIPFGGKLAIIRWTNNIYGDVPTELWIYDGVAPTIAARFPTNFAARFAVEFMGGIFLSGIERRRGGGALDRSAIYYYLQGQTGVLWRANIDANSPALTTFDGKLIFSHVGDEDSVSGAIMAYDPATGGIHRIGNAAQGPTFLASVTGGVIVAGTLASTGGSVYPGAATIATGDVRTSLIDFGSSLSKLFRAIKVEFELGIDGNGGSVDLLYAVDTLSAGYTNLASGITSGAEVLLSGVIGRSISVMVVISKGSSTFGPKIKRISIRAVPLAPQFKRASYVLNCLGTARAPESLVTLRDASKHGKTGLEMVADLRSAAALTSPFTIVDSVNGSFTGIIEDDSLKIQAVKRDEYIVALNVREV